MILDRFPRFRVTESATENGHPCYAGSFEPMPQTYESWLGYLFDDEGRYAEGRFRRRPSSFIFYPQELKGIELRSGTAFAYLDGYWGERAALVLDKDISWERAEFQPQDAFEPESNPTGGVRYARASDHLGEPGRVIPLAWEHDHCAICWSTIAQYAQQFGYKSGNTWICEKCYVESVEPRKLNFIPPS